ncbi:MAG: cysteine desulfurase [Oscillospiraceae bacterium]|nr:cysteine desulfurase [Oscillospiraceae bacterium]
MVYADNAATTKLDRDAFEAMLPWLQDEYGNTSQPYSFARKPKQALAEARTIIASCIGADPEEIFFTSGGTESDNWAIKGVALNRLADTVITSQIEHHAILHTCSALDHLGVPVEYLLVSSEGTVLPETLRDAITPTTSIVSIMMVNNEIGTIEPIRELAAIAHSRGALFHTDAVQAVGHIPIDVKALDVDMLSASAHKFNGPKGIGFLYIRKGTKILPYADGGSQEFGLRAGTENVASIVGMAVALKKHCTEMFDTAARLLDIENTFLGTLERANVDFIRNGSSNRVPGNINISIKGMNGELLLHRLDLFGIYISTGSACDSVNNQVSHVIKAIGVPSEYAEGTIRISFGRDNSEMDATAIAEAIIKIVNGKKKRCDHQPALRCGM